MGVVRLLLNLLFWTPARGTIFSLKHSFNDRPVYPLFLSPPEESCSLPEITTEEIKEAFAYARGQDKLRMEEENEFVKTSYVLPFTEVTLDARILGITANASMQQHRIQLQFEDATRYLIKKKAISSTQNECLRSLLVPDEEPVVQQCKKLQERSPCDASAKYRTADGSCNNLKNPSWGSSFSCHSRILKAAYGDGISTPRLGKDGQVLPSARFLSSVISQGANRTSNKYTHMVVAFGQLLAHDMAQTSMATAGDASLRYKCCPRNTSISFPSSCFPIDIPVNDYFYSTVEPKQTCMSVVRGTACSADCKIGSLRRQVNQQTAFIDASSIYGATEQLTKSLRTTDKDLPGGLTNQTTKSGFLLPSNFHPDRDQCSKTMSSSCPCFQSGDGRVNVQPGLTIMHTTWHLLHNIVAIELAKHSPNKTDEFIFQESRRIVGALMQFVTYKEYLPLVIGDKFMDFFDLTIKQSGNTDYLPTVDPSLFTESNSGPKRFGHSLIQNYFEEFNRDEVSGGAVNIRANMFHPVEVCEGKRDDITRGLYHEGAKQFGRHFSESVTNHLVELPGAEFGLDLVSINIQRGRDHGSPSYTDLVEYCYGRKIVDFEDLGFVMSEENWKRFERLYKSVRDIDVYPGGFSETPMVGAITGPTFACLIGKQFQNSKFGDRFWFEHQNQAGSFSEGQLTILRKATLAKIICVTSDNITRISPHVFLPIGPSNKLTDCESIEGLDFKKWFNS